MATAGGGALGVAGPIHKQEHQKSAASLPTGRSLKNPSLFHVEEKSLSPLRQLESEMVRLLIDMRKAREPYCSCISKPSSDETISPWKHEENTVRLLIDMRKATDEYGSRISKPSSDETISPWNHEENTVRLIKRMNALREDYRRLRQNHNRERARTGTTSSGKSDETGLIAPYQRETTGERETTERFLSYVWKQLREESRHLKKGSLATDKLTSVHKPSKKLEETQETCESNDEEADAIAEKEKLMIKIPLTKLTSVRQPSLEMLKETLETRESNNKETDAKIQKVMIESPHIKKGWMEEIGEEYDNRTISALGNPEIEVEEEGWSKEMEMIEKEYYNHISTRNAKKAMDKLLSDLYKIDSEHVRDDGVSIEKKGNDILNPVPESGGAHQEESREEIPDTIITITPNQTTEVLQMSNMTTSWEIVRCIVAGGLFQSIASLVIVTSAATANIFDGSIVTLALTYLVSGFFFMRHDPATALERRKLREHNRVIQPLSGMLRASLHYHFHYMVTILSLLFFGVVPPLVYAFTFRNFDDKNLKLAAAAGASLSCATLLAVLKAHLEKLEHQLVSYTKTAASFVVFGVVAFVLSYFAGALFGKLVEEVGWFE